MSSIIERGVEKGVFRQGINVEATVTGLRAQIKGIGYHAKLSKRKRGEVDQSDCRDRTAGGTLACARSYMTFTRILVLASASATVSLNVGDTLANITPSGETLAFRHGGLAQQSPKNLIHVEIDGLRNDKGQVLCAIYSSADGFPKEGDKAVAHARSSISERHAACEFPGLNAGTYAISVFHDENSNGRLDTNFMGIPREGVGASNNAKGHFGPPKFDAAAFRFSGSRLELKITVNYL